MRSCQGIIIIYSTQGCWIIISSIHIKVLRWFCVLIKTIQYNNNHYIVSIYVDIGGNILQIIISSV